MEIWLAIPGFERYQLSSYGRFRNSLGKELRTFTKTINGTIYATLVLRKVGRRTVYTFYVHRLLYGMFIGPIPEKYVIDHIDRNSLNNSLDNLRLCKQAQNTMNQAKKCKSSSKFKGVYFDKRRKLWKAAIGVNWERIELGSFVKEESAAVAYNTAAKVYHGEFAVLNMVEQ